MLAGLISEQSSSREIAAFSALDTISFKLSGNSAGEVSWAKATTAGAGVTLSSRGPTRFWLIRSTDSVVGASFSKGEGGLKSAGAALGTELPVGFGISVILPE